MIMQRRRSPTLPSPAGSATSAISARTIVVCLANCRRKHSAVPKAPARRIIDRSELAGNALKCVLATCPPQLCISRHTRHVAAAISAPCGMRVPIARRNFVSIEKLLLRRTMHFGVSCPVMAVSAQRLQAICPINDTVAEQFCRCNAGSKDRVAAGVLAVPSQPHLVARRNNFT